MHIDISCLWTTQLHCKHIFKLLFPVLPTGLLKQFLEEHIFNVRGSSKCTDNIFNKHISSSDYVWNDPQ